MNTSPLIRAYENISMDTYVELCREVPENGMDENDMGDLSNLIIDEILPIIDEAVQKEDSLFYYDINQKESLKSSNYSVANRENYEFTRKFLADAAIQRKVLALLGIKASLGHKGSILDQALNNPTLSFIQKNWNHLRAEIENPDFHGIKYSWKLSNPILYPKFVLENKRTSPDEFGTRFNASRNENKFTDATIIVDGEHFNIHRCILSSSSPFFEGLFSPGFKENAELQATKEVSLDVGFLVPSHVFEKFLTFVYTRVVGDLKDLKVEDIITLGSLAHMTLIDDLKMPCMEACSEALIHKLSKKTFWSILKYAYEVKDSLLKEPLELFEINYSDKLFSAEDLAAHKSVDELIELLDQARYILYDDDDENELIVELCKAIQEKIDENSVDLVGQKAFQFEKECIDMPENASSKALLKQFTDMLIAFEERKSIARQSGKSVSFKPND